MAKLKMYQNVEFKLLDLANVEVDSKDASVLSIEGYASVFTNPDGSRYGDRDGENVHIPNLDIEDYKKNPILVYNHDWSDVCGQVTSITKDAKGLYITAEVHKFTGREQVFESVQKGIVKTFSIGFIPKEYNYLENEDLFEITRSSLIEISLAPVPASADSLFTVTGQKSLTMSAKEVAAQNDLTLCELKGMCGLKSKEIEKGIKMDIKNKEVEEPKVEVKEEPKAEVKEEPKVETPEPKEDPATVTVQANTEEIVDSVKADLGETIADAMVAANEKAEALRLEKEEAAKQAAAEAEKQAEQEAQARVSNAMSYINETTEAFINTSNDEVDPDVIEDLYETLTSSIEKIEEKIGSVVADQMKVTA